MVLALVLSISVLPAAVTLLAIAHSGLESALDDYHWLRAWRAAQGGAVLAETSLRQGGSGQVVWPDPLISLTIRVTEQEGGWFVESIATSGRAVVNTARNVYSGVNAAKPSRFPQVYFATLAGKTPSLSNYDK